jgi:lipopolysaccharide biosynthesis glycosyltransferase
MPMAVSMESVIENNNEDFDYICFHVFTLDIQKKTMKKIEETVKGKAEIFWYSESTTAKTMFKTEYISIASFLRLLAPEKLPKGTKKCLLLDADTICLHSLRYLWERDMKNEIIAGVIDIGISENHKKQYGLNYSDAYVNAGVVMVDVIKYIEKKALQTMVDFQKRQKKPLRLQDQDLLNFAIKEKGVLPLEYNITESCYYKLANLKFFYDDKVYGKKKYYSEKEIDYAKKNPAIIHYMGQNPFAPIFKGRKGFFGKEFMKYKNKTSFADDALWKSELSSKEQTISMLKKFVYKYLPYSLAKRIYLIFHKHREKDSLGTV